MVKLYNNIIHNFPFHFIKYYFSTSLDFINFYFTQVISSNFLTWKNLRISFCATFATNWKGTISARMDPHRGLERIECNQDGDSLLFRFSFPPTHRNWARLDEKEASLKFTSVNAIFYRVLASFAYSFLTCPEVIRISAN